MTPRNKTQCFTNYPINTIFILGLGNWMTFFLKVHILGRHLYNCKKIDEALNLNGHGYWTVFWLWTFWTWLWFKKFGLVQDVSQRGSFKIRTQPFPSCAQNVPGCQRSSPALCSCAHQLIRNINRVAKWTMTNMEFNCSSNRNRTSQKHLRTLSTCTIASFYLPSVSLNNIQSHYNSIVSFMIAERHAKKDDRDMKTWRCNV